MVADPAEKPSYSLSCSQPFLSFSNRNRHTIFSTCTPNRAHVLLKCLFIKCLGGARTNKNAKEGFKMSKAFNNWKNDFQNREKDARNLQHKMKKFNGAQLF